MNNDIYRIRTKEELKKEFKQWYCQQNEEDIDDDQEIGSNTIEQFINDNVSGLFFNTECGYESEDYYASIGTNIHIKCPNGREYYPNWNIDSVENSCFDNLTQAIDCIWTWLEKARDFKKQMKKVFKPNCLLP